MSFDHGPDGHTCSWRDSGDRCEWWRVPDLWEASRDLPASEVCLDHLSEVHDSWLAHWTDPSHPLVAPEMERVRSADLSYPILLHPSGWLMDGYHRVARALMEGRKTLPAVRFTDDNLPPGNLR